MISDRVRAFNSNRQNLRPKIDQPVFQTLMVCFPVKMGRVPEYPESMTPCDVQLHSRYSKERLRKYFSRLLYTGDDMEGVHIEIDSSTVDPACVRFIYHCESLPGSKRYSLEINKNDVDGEMLSYADLSSNVRPTEKHVRNWVFWLGHIVSRFCDPDDCKGLCWVINDVQSVTDTESGFLICGRCSPWIEKVHVDVGGRR